MQLFELKYNIVWVLPTLSLELQGEHASTYVHFVYHKSPYKIVINCLVLEIESSTESHKRELQGRPIILILSISI